MEDKQQRFAEELLQYVDLYEDETIIKIISRNLKSFYIPRLIRALIYWIIILPTWIILREYIFTNIHSSRIVDIIFFVLFSIWGLGFVSSMIIAKPFVNGHRYVITTARIVLYRKFLGISFREIEYKRITDLVLFQPLFGRFWNYGNLLPVTAGIEMGVGKMGRFSLEGVSDVFQVRAIILAQIRKIQKQILAEFQKKALQKNHEENRHLDDKNTAERNME